MNSSQKPRGRSSFASLLMILGLIVVLFGTVGSYRDRMAPASPSLHQGYSYGPVAVSSSTTGVKRWKLMTSVGSWVMVAGVGLGVHASIAARRGDRS